MQETERSPLWKRLAWLVALWCGGVLTLGIAAWLLKAFMRAAGLA